MTAYANRTQEANAATNRMNKTHRMKTAGSILFVSVAALIGGCNVDQEADAEDVVMYVSSAMVGGEVRRLPQPARKYADNVMEAYAKVYEHLDPMIQLNKPGTLWPADSDNWRDGDALADQLKIAKEFEKSKEDREKALQDLDVALARSPNITGGADLPAKLIEPLSNWTGTTLASIDREKFPLARLKLDLLETVKTNLDKLDPEKKGLQFKDPKIQAEVDRQLQAIYDAQQQAVTEYRDQYDEHLSQANEIRAILGMALHGEEKHMALTKDVEPTDLDRVEQLHLLRKLDYHDGVADNAKTQIEALEKIIKKREEAAEAAKAEG